MTEMTTIGHIAANRGERQASALLPLGNRRLGGDRRLPALGKQRSECGKASVVSERELECLSWAAKGKTASETALILMVSEHTVVRHMANAIRKMAAVNRTHAVAKAVQRGLIRI